MHAQHVLAAPKTNIMVIGNSYRIFIIIQEQQVIHMVFQRCKQNGVSLTGIPCSEHTAQLRRAQALAFCELIYAF
ncbi:hypothetical protein SDC9_169361 [bioreactor metagenome]|uniref:Uncharacterized protein n=1 Tax=bioreactor metagenome TaxID=1076179 RepID=A0A645G862_9ZZZZ